MLQSRAHWRTLTSYRAWLKERLCHLWAAHTQIHLWPLTLLTHNTSTYTAGKISIEHVTIFLSKYISKGAVDITFSPDFGNIPTHTYKEMYVWITWVVTDIWWRFHVNSSFRNLYLMRKTVTCSILIFHRCIYGLDQQNWLLFSTDKWMLLKFYTTLWK